MSLLYLLFIPVLFGISYWIAATICILLFFCKKGARTGGPTPFPFLSLIKPVCGLEKNLKENLITAVTQDYPDYETIFAVQSANDPALSILEAIQKEFPSKKIEIVIDEEAAGPNGRLVNIHNGAKKAKGEILVFSDSDMILEPDYLRILVAPFQEESVGMVCTLYRAVRAERWFEKLELLSLNAEFVPSIVFAEATKTSKACPGASQAIRKDVLEKIGGLAPLANYLVEDFELGQRVLKAGFQMKIIPYLAETQVDLKSAKDWWRHQVYWDQNTRAAAPAGFFFTLLIRAIPFSLLYFLSGAPYGFVVFCWTISLRLLTAMLNALVLKDREGLQALALLPARDLIGFFTWFFSFVNRKTYWKGRTFLVKGGKMVEVI